MLKNVAILNTCIGGSTGKIAVGIHNYLIEKGVNSWFCYGREDGDIGSQYYKIDNKFDLYTHVVITRLFGLQGYGSTIATKRLIKFLDNQKVDTIFIISLHGYYLNEGKFYKYIIDKDINLIYIMIDEYAFLGKCGYSTFCKQYLSGCHYCPKVKAYPKSLLFNGAPIIYKMKSNAYKKINSCIFIGPRYTITRAKTSPLLSGKRLEELDEAVNTSFYTPRDTTKLKEKLKIKEEQIILVCVAPYSLERKGCKFFVELARRFENDNRYVFVHVGFDIDKKLVNLPSNYIPIRFVRNQNKLAEFYSLGDLFVFPSLSDTMPNACLEALSAGTRLLCFNISGMPYIADETVATFVEPKNIDEMVEVVKNISKKTTEQIQRCREYALLRYDNQKYFKKLVEVAERERKKKNDSF